MLLPEVFLTPGAAVPLPGAQAANAVGQRWVNRPSSPPQAGWRRTLLVGLRVMPSSDLLFATCPAEQAWGFSGLTPEGKCYWKVVIAFPERRGLTAASGKGQEIIF